MIDFVSIMSSEDKQVMTVYGRPSSLNLQKVTVMCEEVNISIHLHHASAWLAPGANIYPAAGDTSSWKTVVDSEEYRALNPNPTVPTIIMEDGRSLWESNSIVRYLARKYKPELAGGDSLETAATMEKWMDWQVLSDRSRLVLDGDAEADSETRRWCSDEKSR